MNELDRCCTCGQQIYRGWPPIGGEEYYGGTIDLSFDGVHELYAMCNRKACHAEFAGIVNELQDETGLLASIAIEELP